MKDKITVGLYLEEEGNRIELTSTETTFANALAYVKLAKEFGFKDAMEQEDGSEVEVTYIYKRTEFVRYNAEYYYLDIYVDEKILRFID